jgi:hypothetical protein
MKYIAETLIITSVVLSFIFSSMGKLIFAQALSREEAIEISRNSPTVRNWLQTADRFFIEVNHRSGNESGGTHGIWFITWHIHPDGAISGVGILVSHAIDDKTGDIVSEGILGLR